MIVLLSAKNIGRRIKVLRGKFFNTDTGHAHMQKSFKMKIICIESGVMVGRSTLIICCILWSFYFFF